jgi:hypothetical protein
MLRCIKAVLAAITLLPLTTGYSAAATLMPAAAVIQTTRAAQDNLAVELIRVQRRAPAYNRPSRGSNKGAAIIGGIILGVIIAEAIREGRATASAMRRCAAEFRSFDAETGTYVGLDGRIRICPYLR